MSGDETKIHVDYIKVHPDILNHQVENCPTCGTELATGFGMAGGGFGVYGYCEPCQYVVWKCIIDD